MSEFVTKHTIDHSIALKLEYDVIMNCRGLIRENTDIVFVKKHWSPTVDSHINDDWHILDSHVSTGFDLVQSR